MSKTQEKKPPERLKLWLLQSALCLVAVLLVWLLRVTGGPVYEELRAAFRQAMEQNVLTPLTTASSEPSATSTSASSTTTATTTTTTTAAAPNGTTPTASTGGAP